MLARVPFTHVTRDIISAAIDVHGELGPVKQSREGLHIHQAQLLTYLKLTGLPVGLLINFNVPKLVSGVKRMINPKSEVRSR